MVAVVEGRQSKTDWSHVIGRIFGQGKTESIVTENAQENGRQGALLGSVWSARGLHVVDSSRTQRKTIRGKWLDDDF